MTLTKQWALPKRNDYNIRDIYSEPKTCPYCGTTFKVLLEYWNGKYRVKKGTGRYHQKYCTRLCQQREMSRRASEKRKELRLNRNK